MTNVRNEEGVYEGLSLEMQVRVGGWDTPRVATSLTEAGDMSGKEAVERMEAMAMSLLSQIAARISVAASK